MLGWVPLLLGAIGTLYFLFSFLVDPIAVAWKLGAIAVLFNLAACWLALIAALVIVARRSRIPIPAVLIVLAIVFGFFGLSDNHDVRVIAMEDGTANGNVSKRTSLSSALTAWYQQAVERSPNAAHLPLIVVAAGGGGQRAALWTATALTQLEARHPAFREHLFAISGVSGGALGATMFVADGDPLASPKERQAHFEEMLSSDFLSPLVTRYLSTDILQLFLPFPAFIDRAATLEETWERSWATVFKDRPETFSGSFLELWSDGRPWPAMFLNGTWVESGRRGITSNISLGRDFDAIDVLAILGREVRVSTAINMSTRFPYITPVGVVRQITNDKFFGQIADGGYYDNFGAKTVLEILGGIEAMNKTTSAKPEIVPIVVTITSDPEWRDPEAEANEATAETQVEAPIKLLSKVREELGAAAFATLESRVPKERFFHFRLCKVAQKRSPILGWAFNPETIKHVRSQIHDCKNSEELERFVRAVDDICPRCQALLH